MIGPAEMGIGNNKYRLRTQGGGVSALGVN